MNENIMRAVQLSAVILLTVLLCIYGHINDVFPSPEEDASMHSLELTQSLNLARQELIQETCRRYPPKNSLEDLPPNQLEHILINEKHKLLYCYVPKVSFQGKQGFCTSLIIIIDV